jgi:sugar lactone lactonase YvrE
MGSFDRRAARVWERTGGLAACPVQVQEIVEFPTINITSCAFGGPQLDILYVTTAMPDLAGQTELEWGLFAVPTMVRGQALYHHRINISNQ